MNLAKMYIKRVSLELVSIRNLDRESSQESLLLQGVQFAYRAHQVILKSTVFMISMIRKYKPKILNSKKET
jgi:hypothetical protein